MRNALEIYEIAPYIFFTTIPVEEFNEELYQVYAEIFEQVYFERQMRGLLK